MSVGGRYICITLAQESVIKLAVEHFVQLGWAVRLHCLLEENGVGENSFALPVFVLVCTKFRQPMASPILEMCIGDNGTPIRLTQVSELLSTVKEHQAYSVLKKRLRTGTDASSNVSLTLCHTKTGLPRYTLTVQDCAPGSKVPKSNHFAIFIGEHSCCITKFVFFLDASPIVKHISPSFQCLKAVRQPGCTAPGRVKSS